MPSAKERLRRALTSDCGHTLEPVLATPEDVDTKELIQMLERDEFDEAQTRRAIFILGRLGVKSAVKPMTEVFPKLSVAGKVSVLDALGRIGGAPARRALIAQIEDETPQIRQFAIIGLGRIGDRTSVTELRRLSANDPEPFVRETARSQMQGLPR